MAGTPRKPVKLPIEPEELIRKSPKGGGMCFPPGIFTSDAFDAVGRWAEAIITGDYVKTLGALPTVNDWFDALAAGATAPASVQLRSLLTFLCSKDPALWAWNAVIQAKLSAGLIGWPDIITMNGRRNEYYEIKPSSASGYESFLDKMMRWEGIGAVPNSAGPGIKNHMTLARQPIRGVTYLAPSKAGGAPEIRSVDITPLGGKFWAKYLSPAGVTYVKVELVFTYVEAGLLMYLICVEVDFDQATSDAKVLRATRWICLSVVNRIKHGTAQAVGNEELTYDGVLRDPALQPMVPIPDQVPYGFVSQDVSDDYALVGGEGARIWAELLLDARMRGQMNMLGSDGTMSSLLKRRPGLLPFAISVAIVGAAVGAAALAGALAPFFAIACVSAGAVGDTTVLAEIGALAGTAANSNVAAASLAAAVITSKDAAAAAAAGAFFTIGLFSEADARAGIPTRVDPLFFVPTRRIQGWSKLVMPGPSSLPKDWRATLEGGEDVYLFGRFRLTDFVTPPATWLAEKAAPA